MTSRIFPLYNDNTDHIDLNTICGYSICSKAENYIFAQVIQSLAPKIMST